MLIHPDPVPAAIRPVEAPPRSDSTPEYDERVDRLIERGYDPPLARRIAGVLAGGSEYERTRLYEESQ